MPGLLLQTPVGAKVLPDFGSSPVDDDPLFGDPQEDRLDPTSPTNPTLTGAFPEPDDSGYDYDLKGAFLAGESRDPNNGHFDDKFKKPNHPTFSEFSNYAKDRPDLAGSWTGPNADQYVPASQAQQASGVFRYDTSD